MPQDSTQEQVVTKFKALAPDKQKALLGKMTPEQKTKLKSYLQSTGAKSQPKATMSAQPSTMDKVKEGAKRVAKDPFNLPSELGSITKPIENYTQEGRAEHPVLSKVGDVTKKGKEYTKLVADTLMLTGGAGLTAESAALTGEKAIQKGMQMIPDKGRALASLEKVKDVMKNVDIEWKAPAEIAHKGSYGERASAVLKDYVERVTRPGSTRLTFDEARGFLQDAKAELHGDGAPSTKGPLAEFVQSLEKSIESGAQKSGVLDKYKSFMQEYHQSKYFEQGLDKLKALIVKKVIPYSAGYYLLEKLGGPVAKRAMGGE